MPEPARARDIVRVERAAPVPVIPAGTAHVRDERFACARKPDGGGIVARVRQSAPLVLETCDVHEARTGAVLLALFRATFFAPGARRGPLACAAVTAASVLTRHSRSLSF